MNTSPYESAMHIALALSLLGGKGSGNFAHSGREGQRGGSDETFSAPVREALRSTMTRVRVPVQATVRLTPGGKTNYKAAQVAKASTDLVTNVVTVYTESDIFKAAMKGDEIPLAAALVHEFFHVENGRDECGAYDAEISFLQKHNAEKKYVKAAVKAKATICKPTPTVLGGRGSGNFGHMGRPGERGGSSSAGGGEVLPAALSQEKKDRIVELHAKGLSTYAIGKELGLPYSHVKLYTKKLALPPPLEPKVVVQPEEPDVPPQQGKVQQPEASFHGLKKLIAMNPKGILTAARAKEVIQQLAEEQGFAVNRIKFSPSFEFVVDGQQMSAAGSYNPWKATIAIHEGALDNETGLRYLLAHEIQHDKFSEYRHQVALETTGGRKPGAARAAWDEFHARGPASAAMDDGVTYYSQSYWSQYSKTGNGFESAINETLSEMEAVHYGRPRLREASKSFTKLKAAVDAHYRSKVVPRREREWAHKAAKAAEWAKGVPNAR